MSGSVNKVLLVGHLGKDPESKATNDGRKVVWFSLVTSERWTDKGSGEQRVGTLHSEAWLSPYRGSHARMQGDHVKRKRHRISQTGSRLFRSGEANVARHGSEANAGFGRTPARTGTTGREGRRIRPDMKSLPDVLVGPAVDVAERELHQNIKVTLPRE